MSVLRATVAAMSTPDQPNYPGETPRQPAGQQPGAPRDPYAPGPPSGPSGYPGGQPGYPAPGQGGSPGGNPAGPPSYPGQAPYPGPSQYPAPNPYQAQNPYPGQGGYPGQQPPGYPAGQGGYPGYPGGPAGYPGSGGAPVSEPVRPVTVTAAFWCWIAVIAAWAVSLIILLTSSAWDQALAGGDEHRESELDLDRGRRRAIGDQLCPGLLSCRLRHRRGALPAVCLQDAGGAQLGADHSHRAGNSGCARLDHPELPVGDRQRAGLCVELGTGVDHSRVDAGRGGADVRRRGQRVLHRVEGLPESAALRRPSTLDADVSAERVH